LNFGSKALERMKQNSCKGIEAIQMKTAPGVQLSFLPPASIFIRSMVFLLMGFSLMSGVVLAAFQVCTLKSLSQTFDLSMLRNHRWVAFSPEWRD
jgi:hypothetical protein